MPNIYILTGIIAALFGVLLWVYFKGKKAERAEQNEDLIDAVQDAKKVHEDNALDSTDTRIKRMLKRISR